MTDIEPIDLEENKEMRALKPLNWMTGVLLLASGLMATPANAEQNFSDITGTNYWNNVAPGYYDDYKPDPALLERINQLNRDGQAAFQACNDAIAQSEQAPATPRRFARRPAPTPEVPAACLQLESLRAEAQSVQATLNELERSRVKPALRTW